MIEVKRVKKRGMKMPYNIKDAVSRIDTYAQRHLGAKPTTQHDKQMVSGHILPLIVKTERGVERTERVDQETGKSELEPQKAEEMGENQLD